MLQGSALFHIPGPFLYVWLAKGNKKPLHCTGASEDASFTPKAGCLKMNKHIYYSSAAKQVKEKIFTEPWAELPAAYEKKVPALSGGTGKQGPTSEHGAILTEFSGMGVTERLIRPSPSIFCLKNRQKDDTTMSPCPCKSRKKQGKNPKLE